MLEVSICVRRCLDTVHVCLMVFRCVQTCLVMSCGVYMVLNVSKRIKWYLCVWRHQDMSSVVYMLLEVSRHVKLCLYVSGAV